MNLHKTFATPHGGEGPALAPWRSRPGSPTTCREPRRPGRDDGSYDWVTPPTHRPGPRLAWQRPGAGPGARLHQGPWRRRAPAGLRAGRAQRQLAARAAPALPARRVRPDVHARGGGYRLGAQARREPRRSTWRSASWRRASTRRRCTSRSSSTRRSCSSPRRPRASRPSRRWPSHSSGSWRRRRSIRASCRRRPGRRRSAESTKTRAAPAHPNRGSADRVRIAERLAAQSNSPISCAKAVCRTRSRGGAVIGPIGWADVEAELPEERIDVRAEGRPSSR